MNDQVQRMLDWLNAELPRWEGDGTITLSDGNIYVEGGTFAGKNSNSEPDSNVIYLDELRLKGEMEAIKPASDWEHGAEALSTLKAQGHPFARSTTDLEPPTLRPGATVQVLKDTKSINGLNLPAGQPLRVTTLKEGTVTARIGEHGEGLVCTVKSGDVEVVG